MDLLAPQDPKPQEVEVVHASLESLQTTLGAAYMLLAAEAKAESLDAELALAKQTLAEQEEVDHGMHEAHGRCVRDYGELRLVVDDACKRAETLAALLVANEKENLPQEPQLHLAQVWSQCQALLHSLGSDVRLPQVVSEARAEQPSSPMSPTSERQPPAEPSSQRSSPSSITAVHDLRERLREAEENQKAFAATLHSREAQLALARTELRTLEGQRTRYVELVQAASNKLSTAAGTPGAATARSIDRRAQNAERLAKEEEERLEFLLTQSERLAADWCAAERVHSAVSDGLAHSVVGASALDGGAALRQDGSFGGAAWSDEFGFVDAGDEAGQQLAAARREQRKRSKRQAMLAAEEVRRSLAAAAADGRAVRRRLAEMRSVMATLREMLGALEMERSARIALQEKLARDFALQAQALRRCVREQDLLCEVALHKLELHGGTEMARALATQLEVLRGSIGEVLDDKCGGEGPNAGAWAPPPLGGGDAIASAFSEVTRFLEAAGSAGGEALRKSDAAIADVSRKAAPEIERISGLAKSVLEHTMGRLATAAKQAGRAEQ